MTLSQAIGVHMANTDVRTGRELTYEQVYDRAIDKLGGLAAVIQLIPFSKEEVVKALRYDRHLNNLRYDAWLMAAGFTRIQTSPHLSPKYEAIYSDFWRMCRRAGITSMAPSQGVCILKRAAARVAYGETVDDPDAVADYEMLLSDVEVPKGELCLQTVI